MGGPTEALRLPLFMDRHDLPGATADDVVQAHAQDLTAAAKHGVRILAYWFDADSGGAAFCFADAARPDDLEALHRESQWSGPQ